MITRQARWSRNRRRARRAARRYEPKVLRQFDDLVPRIELAEVLGKSENEQAAVLLELLQDPTYQDSSLAKLCRFSGLSYFNLFGIYRQYKLNEAMIRMLQHLPEVLENTAQDAISEEKPCAMCGGKGYQGGGFARKLCRYCHGLGVLRRCGDSDARRLIFEAAGLISRRPQARLSQQNLNVSGTPLESFEDTMIKVQKVLQESSPDQSNTLNAPYQPESSSADAGAEGQENPHRTESSKIVTLPLNPSGAEE